jgi:hypothetical protein
VGAERIWPWSALLAYKCANSLPYSAWRALGNLQKNQYLDQLMARVRPPNAPANTIPFEYDVDDMANLFQLEAVTEFYINAADPWADSGQLLSGDDPAAYRTTNLLALYGSAAQVNGTSVTLDDQFDATRDLGLIVPGRDTLLLEAEPARAHKQFRIRSREQQAHVGCRARDRGERVARVPQSDARNDRRVPRARAWRTCLVAGRAGA